MVGSPFVAAFTNTRKDWLTVLLMVPPSLTVTVTSETPLALFTGRRVRTPVVFPLVYPTAGLGSTDVLLEVAVTVRVWVSFAAPLVIPERRTKKVRLPAPALVTTLL